MSMTARQAALNTLLEVLIEKRSLAVILEPSKQKVAEQDRSLYQALVYGTLREMRALSHVRDSMVTKPLQQNPVPRAILNLGLYQLLRMSLGDHGVVNETVALAEKNGHARVKGLINAILRRAQRERKQWIEVLDQSKHLNVPEWVARHHKDSLITLGQAFSEPPPLTIRLHPNYSRQEWIDQYSAAHINPLHSQAITLTSGVKVHDIPGFSEGIVSVQDASAQIAASLLAPKNNERILDACAAPGGKTGHLLELAPQAQLTALDHDANRLKRVCENLERIGVNGKLIVADATKLRTWYDKEPYDAILLDAPCSGSGVIRRHPDISWLRNEEDLRRLPKTQMQLLTTLWKTLKPGGRLLYTTCSLQPRENHQLIEQFSATHKDASLAEIHLNNCIDTGFGRLHLPDTHGDGFFYALLQKSNA